MFDKRKGNLFGTQKPTTPTSVAVAGNLFIHAGLRKSAETLSGNGALKYSTTGNPFVDQFGQLGQYKKPREYSEVAVSMSTLWAINPRLTIMFMLYLRMITRVTQFLGKVTSNVQRGAGLRHEGIMRMIWLHINHPESFYKNLYLFISVGRWSDIITMMQYDLMFHGWSSKVLDWDKLTAFILAGLENPSTSELLKKYLPQIRSRSQCKTLESQADNLIAKYICNVLFGDKDEEQGKTYKRYRQLKSSGTAHQWQQLISKGQHNLVDFNTIHGRALAQLVSSKYLSNQGLEARYEQWISSKPVAKYTGYPHELFITDPCNLRPYQVKTINAQFMQLVETAKKGAKKDTSLIVVRDTSGSMNATATGTKQSCFNISKALALFFSYMLPEGAFANTWIEFNYDARLHKWHGSTPCEKWNADSSRYYGSTNLQAVIELFVRLRRQGIPESEFPTGILCISDGEFNPASALKKTNVNVALYKLINGGFSAEYVQKFQIILWNLQSHYYGDNTGSKFETYGNVQNVYYFSGFDGSVIAFLTGIEGKTTTPKTAEELFNAAMDQEILNLVEV